MCSRVHMPTASPVIEDTIEDAIKNIVSHATHTP